VDRRTQAGLAVLLANVVWSTTYPVSQLALGIGAGRLAALRFLIAGVLALPLLRGYRLPRGKMLLAAIGLGLLGFSFAFLLQLEGIRLAGASLAALSIALEPLATAIVARLWLKEVLPRLAPLGFLLAVIGTWLLAGAPRPGHDANLAGILLLAASAASFGFYNVFSKPVTESVGELPLTVIGALAAGIAFSPYLLFGPPLRSMLVGDVLWAVYLALVPTLLGYFLWFYAVQRAQVGFAAFFLYVQPVLGSILSWIWLGESLTALEVGGGLLVLVAVYLGVRPDRAVERT
jgi:probable blue pigment (indigoidine) exporter